MTPSPWDDVALTKLSRVVGRPKAEHLMASTLRDLSLDSLGSADDLYRFAKRLTAQQGFAAAVGGLLRVHAVIHGASERTSDV